MTCGSNRCGVGLAAGQDVDVTLIFKCNGVRSHA